MILRSWAASGWSLLLPAGFIAASILCAQPELVYQRRGSYSEGTRTLKSTGKVTLDLVAALIEHTEAAGGPASKFGAVFYRSTAASPSLTVREIEPYYFYQVGDVDPSNWTNGPIRRFEWPTSTVVAKLPKRTIPFALGGLGAVVRLGYDAPNSSETVAPVALYQARPPERATGYRFVFVPSRRCKLTFRVRADGKKEDLAMSEFDRSLAGRPETFTWNPSPHPDGWYLLDVTGYDLRNNDRVESHVRFYHRSILRP